MMGGGGDVERDSGNWMGASQMSVAERIEHQIEAEVGNIRHVAQLLLAKLAEIDSDEESGKTEWRNPVEEVAAENGYPLSYVMHVLWGLESDADVVLIDGRFRLATR